MKIKQLMKAAKALSDTQSQTELLRGMLASGLVNPEMVKQRILTHIGVGIEEAIKKDGDKVTADTVFASLHDDEHFRGLCQDIDLNDDEIKDAINQYFKDRM